VIPKTANSSAFSKSKVRRIYKKIGSQPQIKVCVHITDLYLKLYDLLRALWARVIISQ